MLYFIAGVQCYLQQQPTFDAVFFHWSYSQYLMLPDMNVYEICVSTTGYPIQMIYIFQCKGNSQHSMSYNPDFSNISMENYKREILPTFMLALRLYVIRSLN